VRAQDLPTAEALHQIFDSLATLDHTVNDLFSRLSNRVRCAAQIAALHGTNRRPLCRLCR
jgi:hypothetical protein